MNEKIKKKKFKKYKSFCSSLFCKTQLESLWKEILFNKTEIFDSKYFYEKDKQAYTNRLTIIEERIESLEKSQCILKHDLRLSKLDLKEENVFCHSLIILSIILSGLSVLLSLIALMLR
ncbi:hypothetical protein CLU97_3373 [Chryseobacterium sp. 7]|uniref:hypothetical protein n=1 Tax=Chryseobacterium sp. 7 TaxID=2035214 RepID=UPI000EAE7390|nr:hypothetical protein [Chryseobacterium sp. 7]RLJ33884.1 hypothetical protein CLU97_3373 [Chryseobacterium sp. 7]